MAHIVASLGPVTHDGTTYSEGQEIPGLTDEQALRLEALGVLAITNAPLKHAKEPTK